MAFSLVKALQRRDASKALLAIAEAGESGQGPAANAPAAWLEKLRQPLPILRERIDPCDKLSGIFEAPLLGAYEDWWIKSCRKDRFLFKTEVIAPFAEVTFMS